MACQWRHGAQLCFVRLPESDLGMDGSNPTCVRGTNTKKGRGQERTGSFPAAGALSMPFSPPCQINTWTPIANMLSRRSSAGVAVLEGMLYVAGGNDGTSCLNSVERYNPKTNTWESVAPMNIRR